MNEPELRFGGIARLYTPEGLKRLRQASVCVIGLGGVGSWAAEALARSGVGSITLIDLDDVCVSNVNRQLQALDGVIGQPKAEVMAARVRAINPGCQVRAVQEFFNESTAEEIFATSFHWVLDAIDQVPNKCLLIAQCRQKRIPIIASGGAGGRKDPARVRVADLAQTAHDPLLQQVRKRLREEHGFPRDPKALFQVPCVFSPEPPVFPPDCDTDLPRGCDHRYGTASFVTGTFGFVAAAHIVSAIAMGDGYGPRPD
ncbi:MAG: ThiF family adenylyltransferase [Limisphaerales bacterium]